MESLYLVYPSDLFWESVESRFGIKGIYRMPNIAKDLLGVITKSEFEGYKLLGIEVSCTDNVNVTVYIYKKLSEDKDAKIERKDNSEFILNAARIISSFINVDES